MMRMPRNSRFLILILIAVCCSVLLLHANASAQLDRELLPMEPESPFPQQSTPVPQVYPGQGSMKSMQAMPSGGSGQPYPNMQSSPTRYEAPRTLQQASWTYVPPPPVKTFKLHDIVSIRVDEIARVQAEGSAQSRKNSLYDTVLSDWLKIRDGKLQPDLQEAGDPRVSGTLNSLYRADSDIESRESLSFNIAARIVDIRPNGTLVVEAHKTIFVNENAWETYLSGTCRSADIGPDNVVLSRDLLDLQIRKNDRGRMRDGYRRGWFQKWFETFQPF